MKVSSLAESITAENGFTQIAFDLSDSEPGYLLIALPNDPLATTEFFGHDHYVEVKDQIFGRYGGLAALKIIREVLLEISLSYEIAGVGNALTVVAREAIPASIRSRLLGLPRG